MEPIISPWLIYLLSLVGALKVVSAIAGGVSLVGLLIGVMTLAEDFSEEDRKKSKRVCKYSALGIIIFVLLSIFIPSEETLMAMIAASYATPDNIQAMQGNIVDFVSQIVNAINQAGGK